MKPFFLLLRIVIVGLLWSIFFIEGIRVIMITNWHFDIFRTSHWLHAWNLWNSGWIIDEAKEWAFILIILTSIPVWITIWATLSSIKWGIFLIYITNLPLKIFNTLFEKQVKSITNKASLKVIKKKKSYKEIRPKNLAQPLDDQISRHSNNSSLNKSPIQKSIHPHKEPIISTPKPEKEFTHSLFEEDESDIINFDLFDDNDEKSNKDTPANNKNTSNTPNKKNKSEKNPKPHNGNANSSFDLLKQKGYSVITGITVKNTFIDFIGISKSKIVICLNDKEPGDWLADEERFNDEEPLWFSESSHRVSPVRKITLAKEIIEQKLKEKDFSFEIVPFVIEQIGNIINAEDMFDTWNEIGIKVTRIDRGTPKEIPLFAKELEDVDTKIEKTLFEKIKKILSNLD